MKTIKLFTGFLFLLTISFNARAQDSTWKSFNIDQNCFFSLPDAVVKDTAISKKGSDIQAGIFTYKSDSILVQVISTVVGENSGYSKSEREEAERGFRRGIRSQTESKGLMASFKDSVLGGIPCTVSHITGPATLIENYAVLHDKRFYVFTIVYNYLDKKEVEQTTGKFLKSIRFTKEANNASYNMGYRIGKILGYLFIPLIIGLVLYFVLRRKKQQH